MMQVGERFGMSHLQTDRAVPNVSSGQIYFEGRELTRRQGSFGLSKMLGKADRYMQCKVEKEIVIAMCGGAKWS